MYDSTDQNVWGPTATTAEPATPRKGAKLLCLELFLAAQDKLGDLTVWTLLKLLLAASLFLLRHCRRIPNAEEWDTTERPRSPHGPARVTRLGPVGQA